METKIENRNQTPGRDDRTANNKRILIITALIFVALLAGIWIWKEVQLNNVKKEAAKEQRILQDQASNLIVLTHQDHLKLLAKPFVWAVRTELLNKNINQVNQYANDLVKEKNFKSIVITNDKGTVISATDKKMEGKDFATVGNSNYLTDNSTQVNRVNDELILTSPIMGFNSRLGTAIITYNLQKPNFK
jgi:L-lactate utilization protein LutC